MLRLKVAAILAAIAVAAAVGDGPAVDAASLTENAPATRLPPPASVKGRPQRDASGHIVVRGEPQRLRVCPSGGESGCAHPSLTQALAEATPNSVIVLAPGRYTEGAAITVPNLTLVGEPGAHLTGAAVEGKAALVVKAGGVVIDGIECSGVHVPDQNGACIRIEAADLTVRNVYFHDNQEGILGGAGGRLLIERSRFERNGFGGLAHGIYVSQNVESFIFRGNAVLQTTGAGHGVKSRAQRTVIEGNVIASLDGHDSRAIDIPNGGDVVIRGNVLQKGPKSENWDMIAVAVEQRTSPLNAVNRTVIEGNIFIFDRPNGRILFSQSPGEVLFRGNTVVNAETIGAEVTARDNRFIPDRRSAGLAAYPALPDPPL